MKFFISIFLVCIALVACKKQAGDGGNSSIRGKVRVITRTVIDNPLSNTDTLNAADRDVYIIYGDNVSPDDRVRTNFDGEFEFKYLRPGDYTIYVYSDDTTGTVDVQDGDNFHLLVIKKDITITDKKQDVEAPLFTVYEEI